MNLEKSTYVAPKVLTSECFRFETSVSSGFPELPPGCPGFPSGISLDQAFNWIENWLKNHHK